MKTICVFVLLLVFAAIESNSRANWFFTCRLEEIVINISVLGVLGSISGSAQSVKSATFLSQVCEIDSSKCNIEVVVRVVVRTWNREREQLCFGK